MKSISKVIVASAVAGACSYVSAATITPASVGNYSLESVQVSPAADLILLPISTVTLGQAYVLNDTIELSVTGAGFASASVSSSFTCANGAGNSTVFTLVAASSNSSLLTYAANNPSGLVPGQTCNIPSLVVTAGSITGSGNIQVSSVSKKAATLATFDSGAAVTVASVGTNYSVSVSTILDGVIDVQNNRLTFASGTGPSDILNGATGFTAPAGDEDTFQFSVNSLGRTNVGSVVPSGTMTITLTGSVGFGFLVDPATDTAGSCSVTGIGAVAATAVVGGNAVAGTASPSSATACTGVNVVVPTIGAGQYTVALGRGATTYTATTATAFTEQTYSSAITLAMGSSTRVASVQSSPSAGAWTINGTTVNIPYLPLNANIDLLVNIANRSTQTGAVTFTAWNANGTSCTGSLGSITANANMSVGSVLKTALLACTGTGWAGATRATVQLVIPTPRATTAVNTSFSATDGKSRSIVVNDTNGYRAD
jgi:hypothetical protein